MWKTVLMGLSTLSLTGCSQTLLTEQLPTRPNPNPVVVPLPGPAPVVVTPGPGPTPKPTPAPTPAAPAPAPTPSPTPTSDPSLDPSSCKNPIPPRISRIDVKIHIHGANRLILDSTPVVGPDGDYCKAIGYTDGRRYCPTRPEGHPQHTACDALMVGISPDTGRVGPTWDVNGKPCESPLCENHPDNQFLVMAFGAGTFEACILKTGVCGAITVPAP